MPEFLQLMEGWERFAPVRHMKVDERAVARAVDLLENSAGHPMHRHEYLLKEAITTSDFPYLLGVIMDREIMAKYRASVAQWRDWVKVSTVKDFNTVYRHKVYGQRGILPLVPEKGEYKPRKPGEARYSFSILKYGEQFDISWEAQVNDFLQAFQDVPEQMAQSAIMTENYNVTSLYASAAGPDTGLYGATITDVDGQAITNLGTLNLTIANLETTLNLLATQTDPNGNPIVNRAKYLVVPPALELTGLAILNSTSVLYAATAATAVPLTSANVVAQYGLQLRVDPFLPIIDTSANRNRTWYLFADPAIAPALEFSFLRNNESPEICMKSSDKVLSGGGPMSPFSGDFATDNVMYRVKHSMGGGRLDPRYTYAQAPTS
jgi:hypothetical protein